MTILAELSRLYDRLEAAGEARLPVFPANASASS